MNSVFKLVIISIFYFMSLSVVQAETLTSTQGGTPFSFIFNVMASVNGQPKSFFLDTGANNTIVEADSQTIALPNAVQSSSMEGASGSSVTCGQVILDELSIDGASKSKFPVTRCKDGAANRNNLGMDALQDQIISLNLSVQEFSILKTMPADAQFSSMRRGRFGHMLLPITIAGASVWAMFDTGWEITAVDSSFIAAHSKSFQSINKIKVGDANGQGVMVDLYLVDHLQIGPMTLQNQIVISYDFPSNFLKAMGLQEGPAMVLGTSAISGADWLLDLHNNQWSARPH